MKTRCLAVASLSAPPLSYSMAVVDSGSVVTAASEASSALEEASTSTVTEFREAGSESSVSNVTLDRVEPSEVAVVILFTGNSDGGDDDDDVGDDDDDDDGDVKKADFARPKGRVEIAGESWDCADWIQLTTARTTTMSETLDVKIVIV